MLERCPLPPRQPRKPKPVLQREENKFYSPEVEELSDFLCIPRNAARRVLAVMEV